MFGKPNDYRKITITTYPDGNVLRPEKSTFDFDDAKAAAKYNKEAEKFKLMSIKAQSDTSENETLSDDTLKITFSVGDSAFTFISPAGFINVQYAKAIAKMTDDELNTLQDKFLKRGSNDFPKMTEFQAMVNEVCGVESLIDPEYTAHIKIHDSYTAEHKAAIRYIIGKLADSVEDKSSELVVVSEDAELKNAITDLGMSTYFDIDIEE